MSSSFCAFDARDPSGHSRHLLSCLWINVSPRAREPPRLVLAPSADARTVDRRGARRAARGLRAHRAARRAGARGSRCPDRLGPGAGGRLPPRAGLPDEADRPRRLRGGGALRRAGGRARARARARRGAAEAARVITRGSAGARRPRRAALPRRYAGLVSRAGARPAPAGDRGGLWRGRRLDIRYREGPAVVSRRLDPLGLISQGRRLVSAGAAPRGGAGLPGVADRFRSREARSRQLARRTSTLPPPGPTGRRRSSEGTRGSR